MGKKLAIKGHSTRGKEVIEILEMLGGKNHVYSGKDEYHIYFIDNEGMISTLLYNDCCHTHLTYQTFTLDEFYKKYPYKVGDKAVYEDDNDIVVISEIKWDDTVGDIFYNVKRIDDDCFLCPPELLKPYKETNMNKKKKLAIKGHSTRNMEVIKLLEMMGGQGTIYVDVIRDDYVYFLSEKGKILEIPHCNIHLFDCVIFTLEEFLEKYPFKVGDKVFLYDNITEGCVTGMEWDEDKGTVKYCVYTSSECWCDVEELLKWNAIDLVEKHYGEQCEEMMKDITLKHLYECGMEKIKDEFKKDAATRMDIEDASFFLNYMILPNKVNDELEYKFPDGYKFDKVENGKIILKPIKPKYPKTYAKCCSIVGGIAFERHLQYDTTPFYKFEEDLRDSLETLRKLFICRNAYWKKAGEEMGLGKPWEPDWNDESQKYCIRMDRNKIVNCSSSFNNRILAFPTEEIRDAFYDNFKDLIEQCKELL